MTADRFGWHGRAVVANVTAAQASSAAADSGVAIHSAAAEGVTVGEGGSSVPSLAAQAASGMARMSHSGLKGALPSVVTRGFVRRPGV
jgi:hypothetical protein